MPPTWKHVRAILLLPGMVLVVIPAISLYQNGVDTFDLWYSSPALRVLLAVIGAVLIICGLGLMISTIRMFATLGDGTLAPWNPTQRLVVRGVYRHVRNPMISGVCSVLLGEVLITASQPLFYWFAFFVIANVIYIPLLEEPGLVARFGDDYVAYKRNVPRWIPRVRPWNQMTA
jgi:protein-S-isoprenylcysteine O-methyltransferase Ste14